MPTPPVGVAGIPRRRLRQAVHLDREEEQVPEHLTWAMVGEGRGSVRLSFVGTERGYGTMASILVVGGGMGGLSTAMLLARDGHDVTVLERDPAPPPASGDEAWDRGSGRGSTSSA